MGILSKILGIIQNRYRGNIHLACTYGVVMILLYAFYRARVYLYIQELHPQVHLRGFWEYAALSFHYDSIVIVFSLTAILVILIALDGNKKTKYAALSFFSVLFIFFILFSIDFFRVYQTTFQKNFAGREHFSGLGSIIGSAIAEFSTEFYLLFFILAPFTVIIGELLRRIETDIDIAGYIRSAPKRKRRAAILIIPAVLAFFMLSFALTSPYVPAASFRDRYEKVDAGRFMAMLHEFSMNPVYNLFSGRANGDTAAAGYELLGGLFSFGLNTDSLATELTHGLSNAIPRGKRYNIILYFFESTPYKYYDLKIGNRLLLSNWHRLGKNSLNFRKHFANYPLSANALMSVFTSAYDMNTKDMAIQRYPDIALRTMPEILKDHGYQTCLIHTGNLAYAGQRSFLKNRKIDDIIEYKQLIKLSPYNSDVGWGVDDRAMIGPAIDFMRKHRDSPHLLVLMPVNPHHPYAIPDESFDISSEDMEDFHESMSLWNNYRNSLYYSDACLGMLIDRLERAGLMEDTLLFLFSDHGEAFYQHRMNYNHPLYLYNENVHIPFIIYNKKLFPYPQYFNGITRHIDILPTVLDILGIPGSSEQEGLSILAPHREQMALLHTSWKDDYMGVVDQRWKYIVRTDSGIEELYDLEQDPDEKKNISLKHPDLVNRYRSFVGKARLYKSEYYRRILEKEMPVN
ncbi:MAG: sulfatase-like hydrolase/transferase [Spirochaetes bacterium]|nr:sulfatase-like hydrolase/transferase [Spirochaetota bacterium]